jgi:hypothetical protein
MNKSMLNAAVPEAILRKLRLVRQRKLLVQAASALVAAVAVLLAAMGIAMLVDWLATLYDSRWRFVLTWSALAAAMCTSVGWLIFAWRRATRLDRVAAEVDRQVPRLEERWTTMTRLGEDAAKPEVIHPAMLRRLSSEAASWEPHVEPENVVSMSTLMRALLGLTAVTAVLAIAVVFNSREVLVLAHRFWQPGTSISATKLINDPGDIVIARGEPLALNVGIDGTPVENAILFVRPEDKPTQSITLVAEHHDPIAFSHRMRTVDEPFAYRFRAGDGQTDWHNVGVADRPEIEKIKLSITPPAYTRQPAKTFDRLPERISALRTSRLELALRPKTQVASAELKLDNGQHIPLTLGADGWYRWTTTVNESAVFSPTLTESHGLTNRLSPKCSLIAYEDQPPTVKVLSPDDKTAVRPDDALQITFAATDDVGIGSAELVVYEEHGADEPKQLATIPIDLGEQQGSRSVQKTVDLDLKKFSAKDGTELSYEVRVREDRGGGPERLAMNPSTNGKATKQPKSGAVPPKSSKPLAADNPKGQASSSSTPNSQNATDSTAQAQANQSDANQTASTDSRQATAAKPDASAVASNDKPKPTLQQGNSSMKPGEKQNRDENKTTAKAGSPANEKENSLAKNNAMPNTPTGPNSGAPAPRTATSDRQAVTANNNPQSGAQPANSQQASDAQSGSPRTDAQNAQQPTKTAQVNNQQNAKESNSAQSGAQPTNTQQANNPQSAKPGNNTQNGQQPTKAEQANSQQMAKESNSAQSGAQPSKAQQASDLQKTSPANAKNPSEMKQVPASQPPSGMAKQTAKNNAQSAAMPQSKNPTVPPAARTASSGRQSVSAMNKDEKPQSSQTAEANASQNPSSADAKNSDPTMNQQQTANQQPASSKTAQSPKSESKPDKNMSSANQQQTASNNNKNINSSQPNDSSKTASSQSTPPPGDDMPKRSLDVGQSSTSQRMRLKVDQWAGSYEGQRRAKLEMAISPELEALDQKLAKAQRTSRGVLDGLEKDPKWLAAYDTDVTSAQQLVVDGKGIIEKLVGLSKDTPYAFIGLQLADLDVAHLEPARNNFWSAVQSKGDDRVGSVRDGWQHLGRARQLLADLRGQFERSSREFKLAEAVEHAKKMYQVYVENSHALLDIQENDPDRYQRKMAEFQLDDEYMKRLNEVIKMRVELEAELARILADDPRLLRRFMDSIRNRSHNLREQLADLSTNQETLNREVRAWSMVEEADRPKIAQLLLQRNVQAASKLATAAGELQDRYQSWLPLQRESKDGSLTEVSKKIQEIATSAGTLKSQADAFVAPQPPAPAAASPAAATPGAPAAAVQAPAPTATAASPQPPADIGAALDQMINSAEAMYTQLTQLEVSLRQLASRDDQAEVATFAGNRMVEVRKLVADTSAWARQIRAQKAGSYTGAAEVTQYRLATRTEEVAGKLANLEQQLAGLMQRTDGSLPEAIAAKSREFMASLDKEASPNQLAAVYALHGNQLPRATERQQAAGAALVKSEKLYDELMKLAITEMDKLPVQDPIASLLDDPTLDELLAQLEREVPLNELLGIPGRPDNLRIIGDWLRPGNQGGGGGGGIRQMLANQMKQNNQRSQNKLKQAYQRAIARALKESNPKRTVQLPKNTKLSDWNKLVSRLRDDLGQGRDKAPPEQYRQAIEQYFAEISRVVAEQEKKSQQ